MATVFTVVAVASGGGESRRGAKTADQECTLAGAQREALRRAALAWPGAPGLHVTSSWRFAGSEERPTHVVVIVTDRHLDPGLQIEARCVDGSWMLKAA